MKNINLSFVSAGCACKANVLDWCAFTDRIVYAINNDVGIIQKAERDGDFRMMGTTCLHSTSISALRLISKSPEECVMLSGSSGGDVSICKFQDSSVYSKLLHKLDNFGAPIACVNGIIHSDSRCLVLCGHGNAMSFAEFNLHDSQNNELKRTSLSFGKSLVLCCDVVEFADQLILAVGLTNGCVELLIANKNSPTNFEQKIALKQHKNGWVRTVAFNRDLNELLLATSSDEIIRIWTFIEKIEDAIDNDQQLKIRPQLLEFANSNEQDGNIALELNLDSVLNGHDEWVNSLRWHPTQRCLLSSSMDKNVILWRLSSDAQAVWLPWIRMGEIGGESVGFFDAIFSPNGNELLFHSFFGAFHSWTIDVESGKASQNDFPIGGHFASVTDLDWNSTGTYILSCALDKTTRIFAPLKNTDQFIEIARPQVHGHSLNCIKSISSVCFVSGAEEKIFRVFQAPSTFASNFKFLTGFELDEHALPECMASLPELGLSNKRVSIDGKGDKIGDEFLFKGPPSEDQLSRRTLFPEIQKLYGHGFEVFTVASNHSGSIIATACKASHEEHASILLWATSEWRHCSKLNAHQLTVTGMAFSPDDNFLLSVSRDRTWCLSIAEDDFTFVECARSDKLKGCHSRIIWACAWTHDSRFFATVSRDKTLVIWEVSRTADDDKVSSDDINVVKRDVYSSEDSITALDIAPRPTANGNYLLVIGHENGRIHVLEWANCSETSIINKSSFTLLNKLDQNIAFSGTVNKIKFRPLNDKLKLNKNQISLQFCACTTNNILKLYELTY